MSDRRHSTARWQRLRRQVIARDGGICQIQGPRCRGVANSAHHVLPSSQYPELFWSPENLQAACTPCNQSGGAWVQADNRRRRLAQLEQLIEEQQATIDRLLERLARYENPPAAAPTQVRPNPQIF
jgi:5-methylcytosine-specific restriction endonuclease McrA